MQSAAAKAIIRVVDSEGSKSFKKKSGQRDQEQANFSMELWKTAFMDACERICPVRAGGHDCGCLPVISRLVTRVYYNLLLCFTKVVSLCLLINRVFF